MKQDLLKGCCHEGVFLYRLCESDAFVGRAGSDLDTRCVFAQGELEAVAVVGLEAGVKKGFLSTWWPSLLYWGVGSDPRMLEEEPRDQAWALSALGCFPFSLHGTRRRGRGWSRGCRGEERAGATRDRGGRLWSRLPDARRSRYVSPPGSPLRAGRVQAVQTRNGEGKGLQL